MSFSTTGLSSLTRLSVSGTSTQGGWELTSALSRVAPSITELDLSANRLTLFSTQEGVVFSRLQVKVAAGSARFCQQIYFCWRLPLAPNISILQCISLFATDIKFLLHKNDTM